MKIEALKAFCLGLPGTTTDVKWGADVCFSVVGKMYAATGMEGGAVSLKVPEPVFEGLCRRKGITPAPYLARHHWVLVDAGAIPDAELKQLIAGSHALVLQKHGKKPRTTRTKPSPTRSRTPRARR